MALCALDGCDNKAAKRSMYCSLSCAEREVAALRKRIRESKTMFSCEEIKVGGYSGKPSAEAVAALRNPFGGKSAAHHAFELLREGGFGDGVNRERLIDRLVEVCHERGIPLRSPRERVRRVLANVRSRGFEILKDDKGRFRLTGRRVD